MFTIIFLLFTIFLIFTKIQKFIKAFLIKDGALMVANRVLDNLNKKTMSDARLITDAALLLSNFLTIGYTIAFLTIIGINNITIMYTIFLVGSTMYFSANFERKVSSQKTKSGIALQMVALEYSRVWLISDLIEVIAMIYFLLSL